MILWMSGLGFLSSLALGPASFYIILRLLSQKSWPWASIAGFLLGDLIYVGFSLLLLQSPLINNNLLKTVFSALTITFLSCYAIGLLSFKRNPPAIDSKLPNSSQGFLKSFSLTLANFHLLFIYSGIFINLGVGSLNRLLGVPAYVLSSLLGFMSLLWTLRRLRDHLAPLLRIGEILAACGFLIFSFYLLAEMEPRTVEALLHFAMAK